MYTETQSVEVYTYLALFTDPEGDSCFSIYQINWIKTKKITFCDLKTSLSRNYVYNLQTFRGYCQVHYLRFCCKFSMKIIFYQPVNTDKPKLVTFLVFVRMTSSFIAQILPFKNFFETRHHLDSGCKTVISQGSSELWQPIKIW